MAGPLLPTAIFPNQVIEVRLYCVWQDQEYITKFYWRVEADTGALLLYASLICDVMQVKWQLNLAPLLPAEFIVRQYWCAVINTVAVVAGPPVSYQVTYFEPAVVLGDDTDVGTSAETEWLPTIDAATMNRFGLIRTKNWRPSVRFGPVPEVGQNSGILTDPQILLYNNALTAFAFGPLFPAATYNVELFPVLFSPKLGVGLPQLGMDAASQGIKEWRASRLVGTQRTRKIRAAGY